MEDACLPPPRVVIDRIRPEVDNGRFAFKRIVGDLIEIEADIICDGDEVLECSLHVCHGESGSWQTTMFECCGNDLWRASFIPDVIGQWHFFITARIDSFGTWLRNLHRRHDAGEDLREALFAGSLLVAQAAIQAPPELIPEIEWLAEKIRESATPTVAAQPRVAELMRLYGDRRCEVRLDPPRSVQVDRPLARFSSWYELFPRSWGRAGSHGTLSDLAERLDYLADLGFDVLYMPPIHPIGRSCRKGRNNALTAGLEDVGSPWAVGSSDGGHTSIHPELGTFRDFDRLRCRAQALGIEIALDLALHCSPDHPWITDHPEWFRRRRDGSIACAENPPKRYEDIVPFDFHCEDWRHLWGALADVVWFWIEKGVRVFRVDNPHTKPFAFWEWLIAETRRTNPDVLFLSEAFTRPKTMYRLAKLGFTQSYTYFTWRTGKQETGDYLVEVSRPPISDFFRPNFWPNTPDILHATLQEGGRPMYKVRLVLAAIGSSNWGIYGPAMELMQSRPLAAGSEEYLDSEKYEIRNWDLDNPESLAPFIRRLNSIRRSQAAIYLGSPCVIHPTDNDHVLAFSRYHAGSDSRLLVVVNLDPGNRCLTSIVLDTDALGLAGPSLIRAHDLLDGRIHQWALNEILVESVPDHPASVFRLSADGL